MSKTRLYLDVDGVLNAGYGHRLWGDENSAEGVAVAEGARFIIRWSPNMIQALDELDLDLVWTTTWRDDAITSLAPLLGFGGTGLLLHPNNDPLALTTFPSITWKTKAVEADQLNDPSPFIWIDDENSKPQWQLAELLGGLALTPDHMFGISPDDVKSMQEYIESVKASVA